MANTPDYSDLSWDELERRLRETERKLAEVTLDREHISKEDPGEDGYPKAEVLGIPPGSLRVELPDETVMMTNPDAMAQGCSCGGTIAPVEEHFLDLDKPCPVEHPCLEVAYLDGTSRWFDVIEGWSIDGPMLKIGRIARGGAVIPVASNVSHVRLHKRGEHR